MQKIKDIYSGDVKIGTLSFQTTEKGHSSLTDQELANALSMASSAFVSSLGVVSADTSRPAR